MNRSLLLFALLASAVVQSPAQSLDSLNVQLHGYATQGFVFTSHNNWNTLDSSDGSAAWTEAVVNLSAQPEPRLRIGVQARYSLLGQMGNQITLDWAQADFKVNDRFGIRAGKVKTPVALFNDVQDIDPAQLWVLLPQSVYPIASRDAILAHEGAIAYGSLPLSGPLGKLEYRAFGGQRTVPADDGFFQPLRDEGITVPNGLSGMTTGGTLRWVTPVRGLLAGISEASGTGSGPVAAGPYPGTLNVTQYRQTYYFGKFERGRLLLAAEYNRYQDASTLQLTGLPATVTVSDRRPWYLMASYKVTDKLSGGLYYSSIIDHAFPYASANYQKDWVTALRYDVSPSMYLKFEQHWMNGTLSGFSASDNTSLQPKTPMTLLKLGVSF